MEIIAANTLPLKARFEKGSLRDAVENIIHRLTDAALRDSGYVAAKLVKGEPLYGILRQHEFEIVEQRRIFKCRIGDLQGPDDNHHKGDILFKALSQLPDTKRMAYREQILSCCRRCFSDNGFTRHYKDPFLRAIRPGIDYILAAMVLNFKQIAPDHFLLALTDDLSRLSGFTVIGEKAGPDDSIYSQLLSAVDREYRAIGIYRGLTRLMQKKLPDASELLNVTHIENRKIQRAYLDSGRKHLADTYILRRVF